MDRWGPMLGSHTVRCAEMGTTTRSGGGARAPSVSTAPYAAAQATQVGVVCAVRRVPRGSGEMRYGRMLHGVRAEQGCARSKERCTCVLLGAMSGLQPSTGDHRRTSL